MSKRSFPFNNTAPLQLKTHVESKHVNNNEAHMQQIYAKTQNLLKAGAAQTKTLVQKNGSLPTVCQNCKKAEESTTVASCSFCDKKVCEYCCNVCFNCEQNFCLLCSVISYDTPKEKSYCLSCCGA